MKKVTIQLFGYYNVKIRETKIAKNINGKLYTIWVATKSNEKFEYIQSSENGFKQVSKDACGWHLSDELPVIA